VIFEPDLQTLWPGALIQGGGLLKIGFLRELPIKKRAPLPISIQLPIFPNTVTVALPAASTVEQAISQLLQTAFSQHKDPGSSIAFDMSETYSSKRAMLALGISANYSGGSLSTTHSDVTNEQHNVMTVSYIQKCFTVYVDNPATPADLFSSDCRVSDFHEQEVLDRIGVVNGNPNIPVFLSSVTYGRILYATIASSKSFQEIRDAVTASFHASGGGTSAQLDQGSQTLLNSSKITVSAIGVENEPAAVLIQTGQIQEFFKKPMDLESVKTISFIFSNLGFIYSRHYRYGYLQCHPVHN
jgi:hypothetical protein